MTVGQKIVSGEEAPIENGNRLPLKNIPIGSTVHAIEMKVGGGAQMVRSAGNSAQLMGRDNGYAQIRLLAVKFVLLMRVVQLQWVPVGNEQHQNVKIGKAGRNRHKGKRPAYVVSL